VEKSKYVKYQQLHTPQHRRSKVVQGSFEDRNRYYHCWHCGQFLDITKITGNAETGGSYQMVQIVPSMPPGWWGNYQTDQDIALNLQSTLDPFGHSFVSLQADNNGDPIPISEANVMDAETTTGVCSLCGTANLP
jgi:hypothetical protein